MKIGNRKLNKKDDMSISETGKEQKQEIYHRAGRWLDEPKPEHRLVMEALKVANLAFDRAASAREVTQALTPSEEAILTENYSSSVISIIPKILDLLAKRKQIFVAGKVNGRKYYGTVGVYDPENIRLPDNSPSRRRRVLTLVRQAVECLGRALRLAEILDFAEGRADYRDLTPKMISHAVLSLKEKGDLILAGTIRSDGKGFNLYLPKEFSLEKYMPDDPGTWLEFVGNTFREIWQEHLQQAVNRGNKPSPITTGEVRARIAESGEYADKITDVMIVTNTMQQLSATARPLIKKIKRPKQKAVFWIPIEIDPSEVETIDNYAHDTERVGEAVRRAAVRFGRPVNLDEIEEEIKIDSTIMPVSASRLYQILSDSSKKKIGGNRVSPRASRVIWRVHRIGEINGKAYFYHLNTPEADAYIEFRQIEQVWNDLHPDEQLAKIENCGLKTVAAGRLKLLSQESAAVLNRLEELRRIENILGVNESEIESFIHDAHTVFAQTNEWLERLTRESPFIPQTVSSEIIGWTAQELLEQIQRFYPPACTLSITKSSIQALIGDSIRRIPNPNFIQSNNPNPRLAAKYFYDETDGKLYIAKKWGGAECRLQALLASNELGLLRDSHFVIPNLENRDYSLRLATVACLAFLPSESGNMRLRDLAINDSDSGVRQSALWAYGFAGGENAFGFIEERSHHDRDERIRSFAKEMLHTCKESWFVF